MSCERYRDALVDVAAGEAAPAPLETHLASCAACRDELAALWQSLALADAELSGLPSAEPSAGLRARIRQAVAEDPAPSPWRFGWLWPAMAAAAVGGVALAAWPRHRPEVSAPQPPPRAAVVSPGPAPARPVPLTSPAPSRLAPGGARPAASQRTARRPAPAPSRRDEPEVLVPAGEAEVFLRFAVHLRTRAVSPDSILVADLSGQLPEPKGVEIQPLVIVPLDPAEASGTD
jgi:hypothetical protein